VGGAVLRTTVSFHLDEPAPTPVTVNLADEELAQQVLRDLESVAVEEV
jgi:hypothetical protein